MELNPIQHDIDLKSEMEQTPTDSEAFSGQVRSALPELRRPVGTMPVQLNYPFLLMIGLAHLGAGLTLIPWFFSWTGVISAFVGVYLFGMLGINVCFHRLLSHRSFECPKWFEYSLATMGACCLQESPAWWTAVHRHHHRHTDKQDDPHSPQIGLFWSHAGWLFLKNHEFDQRERMYAHVRDLMRQPFYVWVDNKLNGVMVLIVQVMAYLSIGFLVGWLPDHSAKAGLQMACSLLVWGVLLRTIIVQHSTWAVNSISHRWGYRNFETPDDSRNNVLCGIFSHGEGWHNNHHAHPQLANQGQKWWEVDTGFWAICLFEKLGLAWNVKRSNSKQNDRHGNPQADYNGGE
jgi:stearoyl-CoA desaturase (delta-9 desaturase)